MKKVVMATVMIFGILSAKEVKSTFNIKGMMCGMSCPVKVKESTEEMKGIKSCEVSFEKSNALITYDDEVVSAKVIAQKIAKDTYYKVELENNTKSFWEKLFGND